MMNGHRSNENEDRCRVFQVYAVLDPAVWYDLNLAARYIK